MREMHNVEGRVEEAVTAWDPGGYRRVCHREGREQRAAGVCGVDVMGQ
jgi:hypothetical protein